MTAAFVGLGRGTTTFTYRQSSLSGVFGFHMVAPGKSPNTVSRICTQLFGRVVAFSTSDQRSIGRGCRNLREPATNHVERAGSSPRCRRRRRCRSLCRVSAGVFARRSRRLTTGRSRFLTASVISYLGRLSRNRKCRRSFPAFSFSIARVIGGKSLSEIDIFGLAHSSWKNYLSSKSTQTDAVSDIKALCKVARWNTT